MLTKTISILIFLASFNLTGCGAPTRSAVEVRGAIANARGLDQKLSSVCNALAVNTGNLSSQHRGIEGRCNSAGLYGTNFGLGEELIFRGLDQARTSSKDNMVIYTRGQAWLNASLLGLTARFAQRLESEEQSPFANAKAGDLLELNGDGFGDIAKVEIKFLKEPSLDVQNFSFDIALSVMISGIISVDADLDISAGILERKIVAVGKTTRIGTESILKNLEFSFAIIPHAGDLYVDTFASIELLNIGLTGLVQDQLNQIMATTLESTLQDVVAIGQGE